MRTAKLTINGNEHLLCFSARVIRSISERYGDRDKMGEALEQKDQCKALDESFWVLSTMMDAGARYAAHEGLDNPPPLTVDELLDLCDIADFAGLKGKIFETVTAGKTTTVEADAPKNAGAAREKKSG